MLTIFLVGIPVILVNMLLQSLVSVWCIRFYVKRFNRREGALAGMLALFGIITLVMLGNLAQIGVWGVLFLWLREFDTLQEAVYHSGVNFATLGYGDIVMSPQWKLLGPLEAVNGALMIGLSGASMLAVLQHHIRNQFDDVTP
ncbi:ion channel [Aeromonas caviae]|uniref:ion channel n=1 Tax=Aeromonas caviae TaxID=648 RepID=UPI0029D49BB4|nr:ion channel [Aeromonas caviae]MDX7716918.1 ion channel [Aeromonas caviae]